MYHNSECDNITKYRLLTKPGGLTYIDIRTMTGCSKTTAQKIINTIHEKIAATPNALMPVKGRVTRQSFCEHMKWDFNEIQSFAFAEMSAVKTTDIHINKSEATYYGNI